MNACLALTQAGGPLDAARSFLSSINSAGPLVVAVSGGGDSMALLTALHEAAVALHGLTIVAATVDHGLRSASRDEARLVETYCSALGIRHVTLAWQGEKPATGIQAAARLARYRLLADFADEIAAAGIVTGHTADDQAETVAMRAQRQPEGWRSLSGMAAATLFRRSQWILRPFLSMRRDELRGWLSERGVGWVDDPSNEDGRFERVRVRSRLALSASPETDEAARERQAESNAIADLLGERASVKGGFLVRLALAQEEAALPLAHRGAALLMSVAGGRDHLPPRRAMDRLARFVVARTPGRLTLSRSVADWRRDGLYIYRERRDLPALRLMPGEERLVDGRYRLTARGRPLDVVRAEPAMIEAAAARPEFSEVPPGVLRRALAAEPVLRDGAATCFAFEGDGPLCDARRHISLFDVFLPFFDYRLANRCASLFGLAAYKRPPLDIG